jgi:hypothetical protein
MVTLTKDKKSPTWIVTTTDKEGFHRQLNMSEADMDYLCEQWKNRVTP